LLLLLLGSILRSLAQVFMVLREKSTASWSCRVRVPPEVTAV